MEEKEWNEFNDLFNNADIPEPEHLYCQKCNQPRNIKDDLIIEFLGDEKFTAKYKLKCSICGNKIFNFTKIIEDKLPK